MLALTKGLSISRRAGMRRPDRFLWLLILTLHGCGEPDVGSPEAAAASPETIRAAEEIAGGTQTSGAIDDTTGALVSDSILEAAIPVDTSTAATTEPVHDCLFRLPCRSSTDSDALTLVLSAADGEALDGSGALRIDFTVESTTRDATVYLDRTASVISRGQILSAVSLSLGADNVAGIRDEASTPLVAGLPINGHVVFDGSPSGNPVALDRLALTLREAGVDRTIVLINVPLGAHPTPAIDCEQSLPCVWQVTDESATLTITTAGPLYWNRSNRTAISWRLDTDRPLALLALPGGRAVSESGDNLELYGRELGGQESRGDLPLLQSIDANQSELGRLILRRPPADGETGLARVEIALIEQQSLRTPRWQPVFLNVPLSD